MPDTDHLAQASGQPDFQIRANLVVLDVVVTDSKGAIADELSKDDFEVYEENVLQTIRSFDHYQPAPSSSRRTIHSTAELDKEAPDASVSILVFDELTTSFEDRAFARYSIKQYLAGEGEIMQQPILLVAMGRQHFQVLCDYTTSRTEALTAIDRYHPANDSWLRNSLGKADTYLATLDRLMQLAEATAGHRGHKNVIWVGRGFPNLSDGAMDRRAFMASLTSAQRTALNSSFALVTNALRDARITLYAVDPVGVSNAPLYGDMRDSENEMMLGGQPQFDSIATLTGGKALHGRNDVDQLIQKSAEYGANFYSLAYVPTSNSNAEKQFRHVRLVMKNPKLQAVAREGYFVRDPPAPPSEAQSRKPTTGYVHDLVLAGQSKVIYDALPLFVARDPGNPNLLRINIHASDLPWYRAGEHIVSTDATVLIESFDQKDRLLKQHSVIHTLNRASRSSGDLPVSDTVTLSAEFPAEPQATRLRVVVLVNATGKIGAENLLLGK